jgi:RHS repeat-associated protein
MDVRFCESRNLTGKERDTESGNDYFGARYYASSMGRFLSPDWSAKEEPVPYAQLIDPQSLNLYAYVRNMPLTSTDSDGHVDNSLFFDVSGYGRGVFTAEQLSAAFERIWNAYPSHKVYDSNVRGGRPGTSGQSIQSLTGVAVTDTCALRMSYALNKAGFTISPGDGSSVMKGKDGRYYLVRATDVAAFITKTFGSQPRLYGHADVASFIRLNASTGGIVHFSIKFSGPTTAAGHLGLFKDGYFHEDEDYYTSPAPGYTVRSIEYWRMQ